MPVDAKVREAAKAYVCVRWLYDGLKGSVIRWTHEHGNDHEDPSVLGWILDPEGKVIENVSGYVYNAASLASSLELHAKSSFPLVDPSEYEALRKEARSIARRVYMGSTIAKLRAIAAAEDSSEEKKAEAARLLAAIQPHVEWRFERAESLQEPDPVTAMAMYVKLVQEFAGDEIGDEARKIMDALEEDEAFQANYTAHRTLILVRAASDRFKPCSKDKKPRIKDCEGCRKKNEAALIGTVKKLKEITRLWPDSSAAEAAEKILAEWGFD